MNHALVFLPFLLLITGTGNWAAETSTKTLKIGVPKSSPYAKYVSVKCNRTSDDTCFSGRSITLFKSVWEHLNPKTNFSYEFIPYEGTYYSLMDNVSSKVFDMAVGDTSIVAKRLKYVEFSPPYTETGARMVVLAKAENEKAWIFIKPFTKTLWIATGVVFLYIGIIVWLIERAGNEEERRIGDMVWLSCSSLFPVHGERLRSNLSKMAMVLWLFVALILIQSYTASLTSMLTVHRLRPSVTTVENVKESKDRVGCDKGSFMSAYVEDMVGVDGACIDTFTALHKYAQGLSNGTIKGAFLEIPALNLLLNEYPDRFTVTGPTYEIGGFAFVFQRGSGLITEFSDELLKLRENETLRSLEDSFSLRKRSSLDQNDDTENGRLSLDGCWGLFMITGGMSTLAFVLFLVGQLRKNWHSRCYPCIQSLFKNFVGFCPVGGELLLMFMSKIAKWSSFRISKGATPSRVVLVTDLSRSWETSYPFVHTHFRFCKNVV